MIPCDRPARGARPRLRLLIRAIGPARRFMKFASNSGRQASTPSNSTADGGLAQWVARRVSLVAALAIFSTAVHAQTNTWTAGSASDTNLGTTTKWSRLFKPAPPDDRVVSSPIPNPGFVFD